MGIPCGSHPELLAKRNFPVDGPPPNPAAAIDGTIDGALSALEIPPVLLNDAPNLAAPLDASGETLSEFLLVCRAKSTRLTEGTWHFALEQVDGTPVFSAGDQDQGDLNRLTLLAAVRGLESIDGPSSVTLVSSSRYLIRSLADSLPRWRSGGFMWEHFGRRIDVQHADLWRRIDRAIAIHRVDACLVSSRQVSPRQVSPGRDQHLRVDSAHRTPKPPSDPLRRWLMSDAGEPVSKPTTIRHTGSEPRIVIRRNRSQGRNSLGHRDSVSGAAAMLQSA